MQHRLVTRLSYQGTRWELASDFEPLLRAALASPGRVIKESPAKLVTEHRVGERSYFIKRYRHGAFPFRPLKFFFKASQAQTEWWLAKRLSDRGVPIVRHVALGRRWSVTGLQESILITEGFDGVPANEAPLGDGNALVAFVERMARAGIVQHDLHPANLLVRSAPLEIRLVDLHGTTVVENGSQSKWERNRERMLALLRMSLPIPVSRPVELLSREMRKQALFERSRRCLKTNRDFSLNRSGAWKWRVRTAAVTPEMQALLASPDEFIESGHILKKGRSSTVAAGRHLVVKRYNFKKPLNLLKDLFRGSRGRRGFRKAYHLELCGITTPRVIATADDRVFGFPIRSYVLMEEIANATDAGLWTGPQCVAARALGQLIARLHDEGFTHRDLKETNILFDADGSPYLIDFDGLSFVSDVSCAEAAANLRRLAEGLRIAGKLTRGNVVAFFAAYSRLRHVRPRQLFPRGANAQDSHAHRSR